MSTGDKTKAASQTDGKAAQSKKSEMGMMSYKASIPSEQQLWLPGPDSTQTRPSGTYHPCVVSPQMHVFDQENFQGRMIEITNECMNVCEMGMDRVRSLRVERGP